MLKLLKYEWETKLKKALIVWVPVLLVLGIISLILRKYIYHYGTKTIEVESIFFFINTIGGRLISLSILLVIALFICMALLLKTVASIMWDEKEMKDGYLLLTTPESVPKILASKLLVALPLLLIITVINPMFVIGELAWWFQLLIFYTGIMFAVFASLLSKTALAGKWYKERGLVIVSLAIGGSLFAISIFFDEVCPEYLERYTGAVPMMNYMVLLLIGVSVALFFASTYLLENKVDV